MKRLIAIKCKNGWQVDIIQTILVKSVGAVKRIAMQNNLHTSSFSDNQVILAYSKENTNEKNTI